MNLSFASVPDRADSRQGAALVYAEEGLFVLAVDPHERRPHRLLAPRGHKSATRSPRKIADWFNIRPGINIGIACGPRYGLVVLDADCKDGRPGLETLRQLELPLTLTACTPSGGMHKYFRHPGCALPTALPGIDIKGAADGYVVAPPSTRPEGSYVWADTDIPIAKMDRELVARIYRAAGRERNGHNGNGHAGDIMRTIKAHRGQRHYHLTRVAGAWWSKGLQEDEIEVLLWHHATARCEPPFRRNDPADACEIEAIAHATRGWRRGPRPARNGRPLAKA